MEILAHDSRYWMGLACLLLMHSPTSIFADSSPESRHLGEVGEVYSRLPLRFEPCFELNCGHIDKAGRFVASGR